jgi:hypothetical protein
MDEGHEAVDVLEVDRYALFKQIPRHHRGERVEVLLSVQRRHTGTDRQALEASVQPSQASCTAQAEDMRHRGERVEVLLSVQRRHTEKGS